MRNLNEFKAYLRTKRLKNNSIDQYYSLVKSFLSGLIYNVYSVTITDIERYVFSKRCMQSVYALQHYFNFMDMKVIFKRFKERNRGKLRPLERLQLRKSITLTQLRTLIKVLEPPFNLLYMIQYDTGKRISEVLSIKTDDIMENEDGSTSITIKSKKKGESKSCYIDKKTARMLRIHAIHMGKGSKIFDFCYKTAWLKLKTAAKKAINENISTHWIRTSRAVHLFQKGKDIITVKRILGHRDIKTTEIYLKEAGLTSKEIIEEEEGKWG